MFGELEDSDIYVNNQHDSFEEPSDSAGFDAYGQAEEPVQSPQPPASDNKKILIYVLVLVLLLVCAGVTFFINMKSEQQPDAMATQDAQNSQQMGDYFYDKAKGENPQAQTTPADTAVVDVDLTASSPEAAAVIPAQASTPVEESLTNQKANELSPLALAKQKEKELNEKEKSKLALSQNKKIIVPVTSGGRINPFVPYQQAAIAANTPQFDIIAPPMDIPNEDPLNDSLMTTKISGIMFDNTRPSAIINFDGADHLVHKGDNVKGYAVIDITKDRVVLKYGSNIYRASVGQQIDDSVKFNEVSNLNRQFGGTYGRANNLIEIKAH